VKDSHGKKKTIMDYQRQNLFYGDETQSKCGILIVEYLIEPGVSSPSWMV